MRRPLIMGIVNVTPDSFSDGGKFFSTDQAIEHGIRLLGEGADVLDVGGESTRPGAEPVSVREESKRVFPVVEALVQRGAKVSVDTRNASVARHCCELGAWMINDISGGSDPDMFAVAAEAKSALCLMHMKGDPKSMQDSPTYENVVQEVLDYLLLRVGKAVEAGVSKDLIWIDPGIGFGKTDAHNLSLLRGTQRFVETGYPVLMGTSRKGFLGRITGRNAPEDRVIGTIATQCWAHQAGAQMIRVHDVKEAVEAREVSAAILAADD